MTGIYENAEVQFMYPENWTVSDEDSVSWPRTVSLECPSGGFWSLMVYPPEIDPAQLTSQVVETMQEEYDDFEVSEHVEQLPDVELSGYQMYFYCLDLLVVARALALRSEHHTLLVLWQAEDRDFEKLEPVFKAMTISLLNPNSADSASDPVQ